MDPRPPADAAEAATHSPIVRAGPGTPALTGAQRCFRAMGSVQLHRALDFESSVLGLRLCSH